MLAAAQYGDYGPLGALRACRLDAVVGGPQSVASDSGPATQLLGVAVLEERFLVGWQPTFDLASALEFGVELSA